MEFKEYNNPEEMDYDINYSFDEDSAVYDEQGNNYTEQLLDLIGILEDFTDEDLMDTYGITMYEYLNPDASTIEKVKAKLETSKHI